MPKSQRHRSRRRTETDRGIYSFAFGTGEPGSMSMDEVYREMTDGQYSSAEAVLSGMQRQLLVQQRRVAFARGDWDHLPLIVCLCGSTLFCGEEFRDAEGLTPWQRVNLSETLQGHIVLSIGVDMRRDLDLFAAMDQAERDALKIRLDELHLSKIDLADHIIVLNVGGYVGASTAREIRYAHAQGKPVFWLEPPTAANLALLSEAQPIHQEGNP